MASPTQLARRSQPAGQYARRCCCARPPPPPPWLRPWVRCRCGCPPHTAGRGTAGAQSAQHERLEPHQPVWLPAPPRAAATPPCHRRLTRHTPRVVAARNAAAALVLNWAPVQRGSACQMPGSSGRDVAGQRLCVRRGPSLFSFGHDRWRVPGRAPPRHDRPAAADVGLEVGTGEDMTDVDVRRQ